MVTGDAGVDLEGVKGLSSCEGLEAVCDAWTALLEDDGDGG